MKRRLPILLLLACALQAQAQGTILFQATLTGSAVVPTNSDPTIGTGEFGRSGSLLSFVVTVPSDNFIPMSGYLRGPALPGANGPILFDLGGPTFHSGNSFGSPP